MAHFEGPELSLEDLESGLSEPRRVLLELLTKRGFAIIKVNPQIQSLFEKLEKQTLNFFQMSSLEEKVKVCCEFGTEDKVSRDRLELRRSWDANSASELTPCLRRDQFLSGFDPNTSKEAWKIVSEHFVGTTLLDVFHQVESIGKFVCQLVLSNLGVDFSALIQQETALSEHGQHNFSASILRVLKYPKATTASGGLKTECFELAQDHTDLGLVTLMPCSSVPSLQVLDHNSYEWISVEANHNRGDLVIVVGEQLSFLTNFVVPAARHRVLQPRPDQSDRISFPFLQRLSPNVVLQRKDHSTVHLKKAREIVNHIYSLPCELQQAIKTAIPVVAELARYFSQSESKHGKLLSVAHINAMKPLFSLPESSGCRFLLAIVEKLPNRAVFLSLLKLFTANSQHREANFTSKAKFTRIEDMSVGSHSAQAAIFELASVDSTPTAEFSILFVTPEYLRTAVADDAMRSRAQLLLSNGLQDLDVSPILGHSYFYQMRDELWNESNCT